MKGFLVGLVLAPLAIVFILSLRPGGLRRQLRAAGRRFRLALVLGGIYVGVSTVLRLAFTSGPVGEWGGVAVALVLGVAFLVLAQDAEREPRRRS